MSRLMPFARAWVLTRWLLTAASASAQSVAESELPAPNAQLDAEFTRVGAIRALRDGRVLVTDAGDTKLFVADFGRQTLTQIGRAGQGPNEYSAVAALYPLAGDSTLLPDPRGGRWLLLDGSAIVGMVAADSPPIRAGARNPMGADGSGQVLITTSVRSLERLGSITTGAADSLWILRVSRASGRSDTLGKARARAARITVRGRDRAERVEIVVNPLAVAEQVLLLPDGWVAIARLNPYRVDWITPERNLVPGAQLPERRVPVDDAVKRWVLQEISQRTGRPAANPAAMQSDWPSVIPPFLTNALLAAPDGALWIRRAATEAGSRTLYDVIDRRGRLVRRIAMSQNERVVGFGAGVAYSVATDDDGIERLRRHQLPR